MDAPASSDSDTTATNNTTIVPLDHPLGSRINVRGGGGKTTLARAIAQKLDLPFIELDALSHLPEWKDRDPDDFRDQVDRAVREAGNGWVVDGNYSGDLGDRVLRQSDTVVWLNLPWRLMLWRVVERSVARAWDKRKICGDNTESWRRILSRDSLWWWYVVNRKRLINRGARFLPLVPPGVPVVEITTARDLNRFYEIHELVR